MNNLLTRLNTLALRTGRSPESLLELMIANYEYLYVADTVNSSADTIQEDRRRHWSTDRRKEHSKAMKRAWATRKALSIPKKRGPKSLTPIHKTKLMAGLARYRMNKKLEAHAA